MSKVTNTDDGLEQEEKLNVEVISTDLESAYTDTILTTKNWL